MNIGATHLLFLDNDILVEAGFCRALYEPFETDPQMGQTQAKLRFMHDRSLINDGGGARISFVFWRVKPVGFGEPDKGQYDVPQTLYFLRRGNDGAVGRLPTIEWVRSTLWAVRS